MLVENFRPIRNLKQYGLDYKSIKKLIQKLSIAQLLDLVKPALTHQEKVMIILFKQMGGIMSITGEKKGLPTKIGVGVSDIITGLYSTISILSALRFRDITQKDSI